MAGKGMRQNGSTNSLISLTANAFPAKPATHP
jgi:hypothetical protein